MPVEVAEMKDERMLILSMLQEEKINAEEAASLLGALGTPADDEGWLTDAADAAAGGAGARGGARGAGGQSGRGGQRDSGFQVDVGTMWDDALHWVGKARDKFEEALERTRTRMDEAGEEAADATGDVGKDVGDFFADVERGFAKVASELPDAVSRLTRLEFGPGAYKEIAWHYEGGFETDVDPIYISAFTNDGKLTIGSTDGDEYRVDVVNKVRMEDEEEAAVVAKEATQWELLDNGFRIHAAKARDVRADVVLALPKGRRYVIDAQTADGNVTVKSVACEDVRIHCADGNIRLEGLRAETARATTADGGVHVRGDVGALSVVSADGNIRATYTPAEGESVRERIEWDVSTSDGGIRIALPEDDDIGYELDLAAADGTVRVQLPGMEGAVAGTHKRGVHAFSSGFDDKPARFTVRARTASGSVAVRKVAEEGS